MTPDSSHQLAQLADIHAAAEPGWWPPAPGWWILVAVVLLVLYVLLRKALGKLLVRRRRQAWMKELASLAADHDPAVDPHDYLAALNRFFRAVALRAFPDTNCARFEGSEWVAFIAGLMPEGEDVGGLAVLARGPYEPLPEFDAAVLNRLAGTWVERYG